jgi:hypothetical protein
MNLYFFGISAIAIYILDVFILIWLSGKFVGIQKLPMKDIGILWLVIMLLSWLIGNAVVQVPLIIKPFLIVLAFVLIVYFFTLILDTHILKATAAGMFFLLCQVILIIVFIRQFWTKDLYDLVRYILFNAY